MKACYVLAIYCVIAFSARAHASEALIITKLFSPKLLSMNVSALEVQIGTPREIDGHRRVYQVGGCELEIQEKSRRIIRAAVDVSPRCRIDLGVMDQSGQPYEVEHVTFSEVENWFGRGEYRADCLAGCGNTLNSSAYIYFAGYRGSSLPDIRFSASLTDPAVIHATAIWKSSMEKKMGEDYVSGNQFNCDNRFDAAARPLFWGISSLRAEIGRDLRVQSCP